MLRQIEWWLQNEPIMNLSPVLIDGTFSLWVSLNIMKSIFDERKESATKPVKAKVNEALLRIALIN